jgi:hypothetical protein
VVERRRASQLAEPGTGSTAPGIETAPAPKRTLEGLDREVFGEGVVGGQVHEVGEDVVEVLLGDCCEAWKALRVHGLYTAPRARYVTAARTASS